MLIPVCVHIDQIVILLELIRLLNTLLSCLLVRRSTRLLQTAFQRFKSLLTGQKDSHLKNTFCQFLHFWREVATADDWEEVRFQLRTAAFLYFLQVLCLLLLGHFLVL